MIGSCFLKQEATSDIIANVVSFCANCYDEIVDNQIIFYDMKNYCYLCESCQAELQESMDINCEPVATVDQSLFN